MGAHSCVILRTPKKVLISIWRHYYYTVHGRCVTAGGVGEVQEKGRKETSNTDRHSTHSTFDWKGSLDSSEFGEGVFVVFGIRFIWSCIAKGVGSKPKRSGDEHPRSTRFKTYAPNFSNPFPYPAALVPQKTWLRHGERRIWWSVRLHDDSSHIIRPLISTIPSMIHLLTWYNGLFHNWRGAGVGWSLIPLKSARCF